MKLIVGDFETFWSQTHSLSKMSPIDYVMHPDTEVISLSLKVDDAPTQVWFGEEAIREHLQAQDWSDVMLVAHNMSAFDAMVFAWRFNVQPKVWGCTLAMARPIHSKTTGNSLAKLVEYYKLGVKDNTALLNTKGRHLKDFTAEEVDAMRIYNRDDTDQCHALFKVLLKHYNSAELWQIDATIRMLVEPKFMLSRQVLNKALSDVRIQKQQALEAMGRILYAEAYDDVEDVEEGVRSMLASTPRFKLLLESLGIDVPTKQSPTDPEKRIPALSKTDEEFLALQEHEDPVVALAASTRLDVKSTILQTRLESFLATGKALRGRLPIPLHYCGADTTGRWSGFMYNPQNLPRIDPSKPKLSDALRKSMIAPPGYKVVVADLSGIELRVNHFLWKVPTSMALYKTSPDKADLYKDFAAKLYNIPEAGVSKAQRQMGKVCLSGETLVLCRGAHGVFWSAIKDFDPVHQLWDGQEWVWAKGVVSNGWKKTQELCGVSLTPDHLVLCGTQWLEARYVRGESLALALETAAENLSLLGMLPGLRTGSLRLSLSATVGFLSTRLRRTISRRSKLRGVTHARRKQRGKKDTGNTSVLCRTTNTERGYSTDWPQLLLGAIVQTMPATATMVLGGYMSARNGEKTAPLFSRMCRHLMGGTARSWRWIASTLTGATNPVICGSYPEAPTCATNDKSPRCNEESLSLKHVYDILESGPRNRFTIMTSRGPLVVHNCQLGLGFGAGAPTFQKVAKLMGGVNLDLPESEKITYRWRDEYDEIVQGWKTCHSMLAGIAAGDRYEVDPWGLVTTTQNALVLPSGRHIRYPALHIEEGEKRRDEWWYGTGRNRARIYAGKIDENIVQALARDIIAENAFAVYKELNGLRPSLAVHDELVYVVPEDMAEHVLDTVQRIMRTPPKWWPQLITWSEGDIADTYGDAK